MGFETAHENMEKGLEAPTESGSPSAPSQDLAPESDTDSSGADSSENEALSSQEIIDLDKIEKFKMHGEEWTRDKLASAMLRQADYTRKTQELAKDRKYTDNLAYDIANVLKNPSMVEQFKKVYPKEFHKYLDPYASYLTQTKPQDGEGNKQASADPQLLARVDQIEERFRKEEVKTAEVLLEGVFKKYSEKYPYADETSVISRSLALMEQRTRNGESDNLTQEDWNKVFKAENDRVEALAKSRYQNTVKQQLQANRKAKDVGSGGDAVGHSPKRMTIKEATEQAVKDYGGR